MHRNLIVLACLYLFVVLWIFIVYVLYIDNDKWCAKCTLLGIATGIIIWVLVSGFVTLMIYSFSLDTSLAARLVAFVLTLVASAVLFYFTYKDILDTDATDNFFFYAAYAAVQMLYVLYDINDLCNFYNSRLEFQQRKLVNDMAKELVEAVNTLLQDVEDFSEFSRSNVEKAAYYYFTAQKEAAESQPLRATIAYCYFSNESKCRVFAKAATTFETGEAVASEPISDTEEIVFNLNPNTLATLEVDYGVICVIRQDKPRQPNLVLDGNHSYSFRPNECIPLCWFQYSVVDHTVLSSIHKELQNLVDREISFLAYLCEIKKKRQRPWWKKRSLSFSDDTSTTPELYPATLY